jgi:2',3'-cyclic-nucleotide 3'-phosphodiesterase
VLYAKHRSHDCPAIDAKGLASVEMLEVQLEGSSPMRGWVGGRVVLVPTDRPIDQWPPIAERTI